MHGQNNGKKMEKNGKKEKKKEILKEMEAVKR